VANLELHPGEQVIYDGHPSWRSVMSLYFQGAVIGLVLGAIFWFAFGPGIAILTFAACLGIAIVVGLVRRIFVRFTITDQRLRIQRGIVSRAVQQTRIDRVQNVNTHQTAIQRMLRVGGVDFDTAGGDDSEFAFHGVDDPAAVVAAVDHAQRLAAERTGEAQLPGGL
jgi:uncharacterized membrane protein YdbT with pleckstrin-like domain